MWEVIFLKLTFKNLREQYTSDCPTFSIFLWLTLYSMENLALISEAP